jgi:hypothetical protein
MSLSALVATKGSEKAYLPAPDSVSSNCKVTVTLTEQDPIYSKLQVAP